MKNKKLENSLVDEIISQAFTDAAEEDFEEIEPITLDAAWPEKNIKIERRAYDRLRRKGHTASAALKAVACLAIVIVVAAAFVFSVPTVRAGFLQLIDRIFVGYTLIENDGQTDEEVIFNDYLFKYIPEGFVQNRNNISNKMAITFVSESDGKSYTVKCYPKDSFSFRHDNDHSVIEETRINGNIGYYCFTENDEFAFLSWNNESYSFIISGNIAKEEMIKIAENMKYLLE